MEDDSHYTEQFVQPTALVNKLCTGGTKCALLWSWSWASFNSLLDTSEMMQYTDVSFKVTLARENSMVPWGTVYGLYPG